MSATYLLASLPTLELGGEVPFSVEELRRRFEGLTGVNLNDFDAVASGTSGSHPFTVAYLNALTEVKNLTAAFRASKWKDVRVSERSSPCCNMDLRRKITEAMNIQNPLEMELAIEAVRWQMIDELAGMDYFSEAKVYAYVLKLQINNRLAALKIEAGKAAIEDFIRANDLQVANQAEQVANQG
ncbi:MAG: hypothetical protein FWC26_02840 [Fibromonadales bacterium]|jgi:hypothetical protein|nr:hypothetical protein [Fibromonadales bacterium]